MVTMHRRANWKIAVYGVPHFHIEGPDYRCSVSIATREVIIGDAPARVLAEARAWAAANRAALAAKWQDLNE